ncbi:MAG: NADH:ubiquinone oxidoreductase [Alistipes indistinctus]
MCPSGAIVASPFTIRLDRCIFCNECAKRFPRAIRFTSDYRLATNDLDRLSVREELAAEDYPRRKPGKREIRRHFGRSLRLREVSAGGDNSTEMELNATMNVNFDFARYGVEFTASPRHADGIVITGPITENMAVPLELAYSAVASPKLLILAGTDAVSGGVFAGTPALDRSFLGRFTPDLYVPGNPVHPLTFIHGIMSLLGRFPNS